MYHPRPIVEKLRTFLQLRKRLINSRNSLQVPCNELTTIDEQAGKEATRLIRSSVSALEKKYYAIVGLRRGFVHSYQRAWAKSIPDMRKKAPVINTVMIKTG
jgi:hypothetical protein